MKFAATPTLEKYIQVISSDLLEALNTSAVEHGVSLDVEIATRLMACMAEPELAKDNVLSQQILRQEFTEQEAVAECKRKRESNLYLYEMEKLRLFLRFEQNLPRDIKENFMVIDVKEASKQIIKELEIEEKRNNESQGE